MPIGSNLGITLPTQGGNSGTWGTDLNTELNKIITAIESQVPAAAIDFSTDFDLNNNGFTAVQFCSFQKQGSTPVALNSISFNNAGELIVRDGSNNVIQMTSSGGLNNAGAGGLGDSGGTYGTSGITLDWDGTRYNAKNGSGTDAYANVRMDELQLRDGSGNDLTVAVPSMSSNYTLTLPAAVPGSGGTFLQSDNAGTISYSNATSNNITLSGTAVVKHDTYRKYIAGSRGIGTITASGVFVAPQRTNTATWTADAGAPCRLVFDLDLKAGKTIENVSVIWNPHGASGTKYFRFYEQDVGTLTPTTSTIVSSASTSSSVAELDVHTTDLLTSTAQTYIIEFLGSGGGEEIIAVHVQYSE